MPNYIFICDRKACGERCSDLCHYTTDPDHAENFEFVHHIAKDQAVPFYREKDHGMTANDYQKAAMRTATRKCRNLANAGLGITGEAGEVSDMIKKALFQGHKLDKEHLAKELGDVAWYLALCATLIGYDLSDIFQMNIDKLWERYPEGFESEKSIHRAEGDV